MLKKMLATYMCGVHGLWVIFEASGKAEVRNFAYEVAIDEHVTCGKITMDVVHVGQVLHTNGNSTQHSHDLS